MMTGQMRFFSSKFSVALASAGLAFGLGCATGTVTSNNPVSPTPATVSVTISGGAQTRLGQQTQFSAVVANSSNQAVTWQVNGVTGGAVASGTISAAGLYTAPAALPSGNAVTIGAIAQASASATSTYAEAVWNPAPVLTTATATQTGTSSAYLLDVIGVGFVAGTQIQVGGTAVATTLKSATEVTASYTPVAGATSASISVANPAPGASSSSAVAVAIKTGLAVTVTIAGSPQTRLGQTTQFTATVANNSNQAVTWQVNGTTGRVGGEWDDQRGGAVYRAGSAAERQCGDGGSCQPGDADGCEHGVGSDLESCFRC